MSNPKPPAKRGCLFYGCLSISIILLLVLLFLGIGFYFAKRTFDQFVTNYTDTQPAKIELKSYAPPKLQELKTRIGVFRQALDKPAKADNATATDPMELVLTADDLNALIADTPELKGRVMVSIDDNEIKGEVSARLDDFNIPLDKLKGRYLNGTATFKVSIQNGKLDLRVSDVMVRGKQLPALLLNELKKQNLVEQQRMDPQAEESLKKIESLEVREGKIHIRGRFGATGAAGTTPAAPAAPPGNP